MQRSYTIIQDTNEKKPLLFPSSLVTLNDHTLATSTHPSIVIKLSIKKQRLGKAHPEVTRGDYYLEGYPSRIIIERKGNLREIANNLTKPRSRRNFIAELDYLQTRCKWPIILLEGTPSYYLTPTKEVPIPQVALASLLRLCLERRIWLHFVPKGDAKSRLAAGTWAAQMLIAGAVTRLTP